jgi:GNAT superfamily N-acetyltransferase
MAIELTTVIARAAPDKVSVERTDDLELLAGPLSAGYGFPPRFLTRGPPGLLDRCDGWVAHVDGTPAAGLLLVRHERDAGVFMVATAPEFRQRGVAGHALRTALLDARERGRTSSTLQSSALGRSVYAALAPRSSAPTSYGSTGLASTRTLKLYRPPTRRQWRRSRDRCQACRGTTGLSHYPSPYALICFAVST